MKGQVAIMEYVVMLVMIIFIVLFVMLMVFGFQIIGAGSSQSEDLERRSLFLLQRMLVSEAITASSFQKGSVFDDAKLTALNSLDCDDFRELYGEDTWAKVNVIYEKNDCPPYNPNCNAVIEDMEDRECTSSNYPECGYWEFCSENKDPRMAYRAVPVNIYLKLNETTVMGFVNVGVKVTE